MIHDVQFDDFAFQQAQRPFRAAFGRLRASQGDEPGLFLAVEDARNGRRRALLAVVTAFTREDARNGRRRALLAVVTAFTPPDVGLTDGPVCYSNDGGLTWQLNFAVASGGMIHGDNSQMP